LTVGRNGGVRLDLPEGLFEYRLSKDRLTRLEETISAAQLSSMKDDYPSRSSNDDHEWVWLAVADGEGQRKRIRFTSESPEYPEGLRILFDLRLEGLVQEHGVWCPGGVLYRLISDARKHPVAAISVGVKLPKRRYRVDEPIEATIVVRNIGTKPVFVPSLDSQVIARGEVDARLLLRPSRPPWVADSASDDFGESSTGDKELDIRLRDDIGRMVRIAPGAAWEVPAPRPLVAHAPGQYLLDAGIDMRLCYDRETLERIVGARVVYGLGSDSASVHVLGNSGGNSGAVAPIIDARR
jgi:hypothetical protein